MIDNATRLGAPSAHTQGRMLDGPIGDALFQASYDKVVGQVDPNSQYHAQPARHPGAAIPFSVNGQMIYPGDPRYKATMEATLANWHKQHPGW
jgi:hypothetical protein